MHLHKLKTLARLKDGQNFPLASTKKRHIPAVMPVKPVQQRLQHATDSASLHQQLSELAELESFT